MIFVFNTRSVETSSDLATPHEGLNENDLIDKSLVIVTRAEGLARFKSNTNSSCEIFILFVLARVVATG